MFLIIYVKVNVVEGFVNRNNYQKFLEVIQNYNFNSIITLILTAYFKTIEIDEVGRIMHNFHNFFQLIDKYRHTNKKSY